MSRIFLVRDWMRLRNVFRSAATSSNPSPNRALQAGDVQVRTARESPNPLAGVIGNFLLKQGKKSILQRSAVLLEKREQVGGEPLAPVPAFNGIEHRAQLIRQSPLRHTRLHPAIEDVGRELPLQYSGCVQE